MKKRTRRTLDDPEIVRELQRTNRLIAGLIVQVARMQSRRMDYHIEIPFESLQAEVTRLTASQRKLEAINADAVEGYLALAQAIAPDEERADREDWPVETLAALAVGHRKEVTRLTALLPPHGVPGEARTEHELKTWPDYYRYLVDGSKNF